MSADVLKCYYKFKDESDHWKNEDVSSNILNKIYLTMESASLYEFTVLNENNYECRNCNVSVDGELCLLILENQLYAVGKTLMQKEKTNLSINVGNVQLDSVALSNLKNTFRRHSFSVYQNVIYNKVQNRIIQRIMRRNKFYKIQKIFVPVFIQVKNLYNPFFDDAENVAYKHSDLYKKAVEKNRIVEVGKNITCYMLTHKEICEALHLNRFMRFTPDFVYEVFVGLLHPEYSEFPNKTAHVWVPGTSSDVADSLPKKMNDSELFSQLKEYEEILSKPLSEEDKARYSAIYHALQDYQSIDTLRYACIRHKKALLAYGPSILDGSVTEGLLYSIILEARL